MQLRDIIEREPRPEAWSEADNIPWNEPGFSARMLKEHLSQAHDAASRRAERIDRHVAFIHGQLLGGRAARVLDLGCGPGLYAQRLARLGHSVRGIDYSPASIEYARQQAAVEGLACAYELADLRAAAFGTGYDLVLLVYGELNVFPRPVARELLRKAHAALKPGGRLLLEPHTYEGIRREGAYRSEWWTAAGGLFSAQPHLALQESWWDAEGRTRTDRYFVLEAGGGICRYAASYQAYTDDEYRALLAECGFDNPQFYPSLAGEQDVHPGLQAITALRPA
jgi:SAM-dependent methyltransferase